MTCIEAEYEGIADRTEEKKISQDTNCSDFVGMKAVFFFQAEDGIRDSFR